MRLHVIPCVLPSVLAIALLSALPGAAFEPVTPGGGTAAPELGDVLAPLARSSLASPLADGFPAKRLRSRALVRLSEVTGAQLRKALTDGGAAAPLRQRIADIALRTGYELHVVRVLPFDWAVFDVVPAGTRARLDEEQTLVAVTAIASHKDLVAGSSDERWYKTLATPNDPGMQYTWHYDAMGTQAAWDIVTGDSGQRVGVVDTGTVRNHQDLQGKDVAGYDFISFTESSKDGDARDADWDDPGDGGQCGSDSFHGSHVAGTILASTGNNVGIAGINWGAQLVTGRALGECGGSSGDILEALAWMSGYVIDDVPNISPGDVVDVINLSLGQDGDCSQAEEEFISTILGQTNVVFVGAAGNSGNDVPVGSPANCPGVISVGAHGPGSNRPLAPYSNWSSDLDVIAPGGDIGSTGVVEDGVLSACGPASDCYAFEQGTSMAAPHVTGAASILRAANPQLTATQINDLLQNNGEFCGSCDGTPAIDLGAATAVAANMPGGGGVPPPPPPPEEPDPVEEPPVPTEPGPATVDGECELLRGNWDCANGFGCRETSAGPLCIAGAEGTGRSGAQCALDTACASGLCDNGVCTVPCDDGCRDGYTCDVELIPGGLCRADSCAESEGDICQLGWHCTFTSADRYACATDGEDVFAPLCACVSTSGPTLPLFGALPLLLGALFLRRRRRR